MQNFRIALLPVLLLCGVGLLAGCRGKQPASHVAVPPMALLAHPALPPVVPVFLYPGWKPTPLLFWIGKPKLKPPLVALTFDAGKDASGVPLILKTLAAHHTRATFFLTGEFCKRCPHACRAIADAGMELGNHSYSHPHFSKISPERVQRELDRAEATIVAICGRGAKPLFRFPYGNCNKRTREEVAARGYQPIHWTLDSLDSFGRPKSADFVAKRIIRRIKPGYITLMHVSQIETAKALPRIFAYLDKIGARSVPISELMRREHP